MSVANYTEEFSNTDSNSEKLMYLIYQNVMLKITRLQDMFRLGINTLKIANFEEYINSENFTKLGAVVAEYFTKYKVIFNEKWDSKFG